MRLWQGMKNYERRQCRKKEREREKRKTGRLTFRFNNFRLHSNFADCCVAAEVVKVELCGWNMTEEVE